jgi:hypothetical protein
MMVASTSVRKHAFFPDEFWLMKKITVYLLRRNGCYRACALAQCRYIGRVLLQQKSRGVARDTQLSQQHRPPRDLKKHEGK